MTRTLSSPFRAAHCSWPRLQRLQFNLERLVPDNRHNHHGNGGIGGGSDGGGTAGTEIGPGVGGARVETVANTAAGSWWRRGCVVAVHADGTRLRVDEHGLPLIGRSGKRGGSRRRARGRGEQQRIDDDGNDDEEGELGLYDRVLVDAPCSGLGRLQLHRPSSYSRWDERQVERHPERQRLLLLRGARLLRRGGSLVYSTCTMDPRENEAVGLPAGQEALNLTARWVRAGTWQSYEYLFAREEVTAAEEAPPRRLTRPPRPTGSRLTVSSSAVSFIKAPPSGPWRSSHRSDNPVMP